MPVLARSDIEGRITNGETARPGQFPYQVGLSLTKNALVYFWCGGSLIGDRWVLTAAHCLEDINFATVYLGAFFRNLAKVTYIVPKSKFTTHFAYNSQNLNNDIALIEIPRVIFSYWISPVKLPAISTTYPSYAGDIAIASGWGLTSDSSTAISGTLQYGRLQVIDNQSCSATFGSAFVTGNIVCVDTSAGTSTCGGDSGGPLVETNEQLLIGVSSFVSSAGCQSGAPAGFVRITSYLDWVKTNTGISY
ncbi:serine protease 1-like [Drosophila innubila]|uniref:serine protease 1-like n=1 Tax=Drosophila innubila TaxID=198719 RepID=UPI00148E7AD6|nr:serine protease 1-like [Drosophila innubila]